MKHYAVRNRDTKKFHRTGKVTQFYKTKEEAKAKRKELNGLTKDEKECFNSGWTVTTKEID